MWAKQSQTEIESVFKQVKVIDLLMGFFRGAVFRHGGVALKQPIKQPTETPAPWP